MHLFAPAPPPNSYTCVGYFHLLLLLGFKMYNKVITRPIHIIKAASVNVWFETCESLTVIIIHINKRIAKFLLG